MGLSKVQAWKTERLRHMSGGEKLKLALAHIWKTMPEILILDEAFRLQALKFSKRTDPKNSGREK